MTSKASSGSPPWFSGWASASMMCRNSTIEPGQPCVIDQRQRPRRALDLGAGLADEVQALRADIDQVVRPAVDRLLAALPVVAVPPVVDQLGQESGIGAGGPRAVVGDGDRRPPAAQALVEIDQRPFGNVDLEGLGSVVARVGHHGDMA